MPLLPSQGPNPLEPAGEELRKRRNLGLREHQGVPARDQGVTHWGLREHRGALWAVGGLSMRQETPVCTAPSGVAGKGAFAREALRTRSLRQHCVLSLEAHTVF